VSDKELELPVAEQTELEPAQAEPEAVELTDEEQSAAKEEADKEAEAEAERKAERKEKRLERKEHYALKAKADYLEREIRRLQQPVRQEDTSGDFEAETEIERFERYIVEREQKAKAEEKFSKSTNILEDAADEGDFDVDDFIPLPVYAADAVVESDMAVKLVVYLQKNPAEIKRIESLSQIGQVREIVKLEKMLSEQVPVKKSGAPAPIRPVSGRSVASNELSDDLSMAEWLEMRNKQLYKR
jgi:hypothetical protein